MAEKDNNIVKDSKKEFRDSFLLEPEFQKINNLLEKNALDPRKKSEHEQYNTNEMMMNMMFVQETDDRFIKFIEQKRLNALKELQEIEKAGEEEITKRKAEYDEYLRIRELGNDKDEASRYYFYSQAFNSDTIAEFKEENEEYSNQIDKKLEEERLLKKEEAILKIKEKSPHIEDESAISSMAEKASVGKLFVDKMGIDVKDVVSLGLTTFSLATNPAGFFTNKAAKALFKGFMNTDAGKNLSNNMKERFDVFQNGHPVLGKGLKIATACLGMGVLAAIGANMEDIQEFASHLYQSTSDFAPTLAGVGQDVFNGQTFILGEKFSNLESLTRSIMPEGSSYKEIQEMTMKLAEYNGIDDPDVVKAGFEFKVPKDLSSLTLDVPNFEINNIEDIKNLNKIPYGANIKAEDLIKNVEKIVNSEFANEPGRAHEFMVNFKQQVGFATDDNGIVKSFKDLKGDTIYEQQLGQNRVPSSDEQEVAVHGFDEVKNTLEKTANDLNSKAPEKEGFFSKLGIGGRGKH